MANVTVVLGSQWGDEGKGKLVDILSSKAQICARAQGGNNAGHTIVAEGKTLHYHMIPSGLGLINQKCVNLIGSGTVVHIPAFFQELEALKAHGVMVDDRLFISDRAHVVLDLHQRVDGLEERELSGEKIGTTGKGIGPTYSTKMTRSGIRISEIFDEELFETKLRRIAAGFKKRYGDLLEYDPEAEIAAFKEYRQKLAPFVIDQVPFLQSAKASNTSILVEGANAIMLDIDHGTYPYVTSSNTGLGGILTGLTLGWRSLKDVIGVVKAYTTRVGGGPFPTEQLNDVGVKLQEEGREWGVTTGRRRRTGWFDAVVVAYSHQVNDYTSLNLTKLDVLDDFDELKVAVAYKYNGEKLDSFPASLDILEKVEVVYETLPGWKSSTSGSTKWEQLPENAQKYIEFIETFLGHGLKIKYIGTGPDREHMIVR
ncbi:adenylosuccinate synthetase [Pseudogymnoascus sp. 05NY08]|nr:adenylosuccinate synthetase [Pseudogymnoascus sp. 05NY08]